MLLVTALGILSQASSCPDHTAIFHLSWEANSGWMDVGVSPSCPEQLPEVREVSGVN